MQAGLHLLLFVPQRGVVGGVGADYGAASLEFRSVGPAMAVDESCHREEDRLWLVLGLGKIKDLSGPKNQNVQLK